MIAVHHESGKVFWTDGNGTSTGGGIYRANLDFSNVEHIVPNLPYLRGIAIDEPAGRLYVARQVGPTYVFSCDLNGGGLVGLNLGPAFGIACVPEKLGFVCFGDANGDLVVNVNDLLAVINSWGPCQSCATDFNGDGVVDVIDVMYVIDHWTQ
jgi:hypothetical protein